VCCNWFDRAAILIVDIGSHIDTTVQLGARLLHLALPSSSWISAVNSTRHNSPVRGSSSSRACEFLKWNGIVLHALANFPCEMAHFSFVPNVRFRSFSEWLLILLLLVLLLAHLVQSYLPSEMLRSHCEGAHALPLHVCFFASRRAHCVCFACSSWRRHGKSLFGRVFVNRFPDGRDDSWLADILLILARNEVERIEHLVCFARCSSIVSS
jgi:hypothetical protein